MFCIMCGHSLSDGALFCPMCGSKAERPAGAAQRVQPQGTSPERETVEESSDDAATLIIKKEGEGDSSTESEELIRQEGTGAEEKSSSGKKVWLPSLIVVIVAVIIVLAAMAANQRGQTQESIAAGNSGAESTSREENEAGSEARNENISDREKYEQISGEAYSFLEGIIDAYFEGNVDPLVDHFSEQMMNAYDKNREEFRSEVRVNRRNLKLKSYEIEEQYMGTEKAYWSVLVGFREEDDKYNEEFFSAFKENGKWVVTIRMFMNRNPDFVTEPATMREVMGTELYREVFKDYLEEKEKEEAADTSETETTVVTTDSEEGESLTGTASETAAVTMTAEPVSTVNGKVVVSLVASDAAASTITIQIKNDMGEDISTFGLPTLVIDGQSVALDTYQNMKNSLVNVVTGSTKEITYTVDSRFFESGGELVGNLHSLDLEAYGANYRLKITPQS